MKNKRIDFNKILRFSVPILISICIVVIIIVSSLLNNSYKANFDSNPNLYEKGWVLCVDKEEDKEVVFPFSIKDGKRECSLKNTLGEVFEKAHSHGIFNTWSDEIITNLGFNTIAKMFKGLFKSDLISTIRKYSVLTNAIKHGIGLSLNDLETNYPEFFYPSKEYTKKSKEGYVSEYARPPLVTKEHFEELYASLLEFWKEIPPAITINVQNLTLVEQEHSNG